jgi:hypothetical protein
VIEEKVMQGSCMTSDPRRRNALNKMSP